MSENISFKIKLAGLSVEMRTRYEENKQFCSEYISDENCADVVAETLDSEIDAEIKRYDSPLPRDYCENVCLYRAIAEALPEFDRFVFHGAAVRAFGRGYIFAAPSGTGKSTHVRLLTEHFGDEVSVINGDKPILKVGNDSVTVYSTPWAGKEGWQTKGEAPLSGIILLRRGNENSIRRISPSEYFDELMRQVYFPKNGEMLLKTLSLLDELSKSVEFYLLECDISRAAAETSYKVMKDR